MAIEAFTLEVKENGRIFLPVAFRQRMGVQSGDRLIARVTERGKAELVTASHAVATARRIFAHLAPKGGSMVDELIRERRGRKAAPRGAEQVTTVLDASILLAWLQGEPGADQVDEALKQGAVIHVVNWAEVLTRLVSKGLPAAEATRQLSERGILGQLLTVDPGTLQDAEVAANLYGVTRGAGLSLGDRSCLALAQRLGVTVFTAEGQWATLQIGVVIQAIR